MKTTASKPQGRGRGRGTGSGVRKTSGTRSSSGDRPLVNKRYTKVSGRGTSVIPSVTRESKNVVATIPEYVDLFLSHSGKSDETLYKNFSLQYEKLFLEYIKKDGTARPIVSDIPETLEYYEDHHLPKSTIHLMKRKSFLNQLSFLSSHPDLNIVICTGGAPYTSIYHLSTYFPEHKFILVDKDPIAIRLDYHSSTHLDRYISDIVYLTSPPIDNVMYSFKEKSLIMGEDITQDISSVSSEALCNYIALAPHRIFIIQEEFTVKLAEKFKPLVQKASIGFISDFKLRSSPKKDPSDIDGKDLDVIWNMSKQFNYVMTLKPHHSMLKIRQPFYLDHSIKDFNDRMNKSPYSSDFKHSLKIGSLDFIKDYMERKWIYLKGDFYVQAWSGQNSTETHIYVSREELSDPEYIEYDSNDYENRLFFYNHIDRPFVCHTHDLVDKKLKIDLCGDCALEIYIWNLYKTNILSESDIESDIELDIKKAMVNLSSFTQSFDLAPHGFLYDYVTPSYIRDHIIPVQVKGYDLKIKKRPIKSIKKTSPKKDEKDEEKKEEKEEEKKEEKKPFEELSPEKTLPIRNKSPKKTLSSVKEISAEKESPQ